MLYLIRINHHRQRHHQHHQERNDALLHRVCASLQTHRVIFIVEPLLWIPSMCQEPMEAIYYILSSNKQNFQTH